MEINPVKRAKWLAEVEDAAKAQVAATSARDQIIAMAVLDGCTQTEVAKAAGMSQAHVSRAVAVMRALDREVKTLRRRRRQSEGRTL